LKQVVDATRPSPASDYEIDAVAGSDGTLGYIYILFLFSGFAWCTWAYLWSFNFKSDAVAFVVLLILLGLVAFIDMILYFGEIIVINSSTPIQRNGLANLLELIRYLMALVFPNVTIKRGFYNLKIRKNDYCITNVNTVMDRELIIN
jgi:hypothetical protein